MHILLVYTFIQLNVTGILCKLTRVCLKTSLWLLKSLTYELNFSWGKFSYIHHQPKNYLNFYPKPIFSRFPLKEMLSHMHLSMICYQKVTIPCAKYRKLSVLSKMTSSDCMVTVSSVEAQMIRIAYQVIGACKWRCGGLERYVKIFGFIFRWWTSSTWTQAKLVEG